MKRSRSFRSTGLWLGLSFAATLGCSTQGPQMAPVSGVVLMNEQPVAGAAVLFMPDESGPAASGTTDAQGKFHLTTSRPSDGAVIGSYRVTVTLKETSGIATEPGGLSGEIAPGGVKEKWIVPQRYSVPDTSGLRATVEKGLAPLEFRLTSP